MYRAAHRRGVTQARRVWAEGPHLPRWRAWGFFFCFFPAAAWSWPRRLSRGGDGRACAPTLVFFYGCVVATACEYKLSFFPSCRLFCFFSPWRRCTRGQGRCGQWPFVDRWGDVLGRSRSLTDGALRGWGAAAARLGRRAHGRGILWPGVTLTRNPQSRARRRWRHRATCAAPGSGRRDR